jgi:rhodanese-related sulfurtransferase
MTSKVQAMGKGVEVPRVTKEQLLSMTGKPEVVILDVRESESWEKSKQKIQGAVREDPEKDVQGWFDKYPKDKTLVFYCS